jgi:hypothetical protein
MPDFISKAADAFLHPGGWYLFVRVVTASYAVSAIGRLIPVRRKQVAGYRGKPGRTVALSAGGLAIACAIATLTYGATARFSGDLAQRGLAAAHLVTGTRRVRA